MGALHVTSALLVGAATRTVSTKPSLAVAVSLAPVCFPVSSFRFHTFDVIRFPVAPDCRPQHVAESEPSRGFIVANSVAGSVAILLLLILPVSILLLLLAARAVYKCQTRTIVETFRACCSTLASGVCSAAAAMSSFVGSPRCSRPNCNCSFFARALAAAAGLWSRCVNVLPSRKRCSQPATVADSDAKLEGEMSAEVVKHEQSAGANSNSVCDGASKSKSEQRRQQVHEQRQRERERFQQEETKAAENAHSLDAHGSGRDFAVDLNVQTPITPTTPFNIEIATSSPECKQMQPGTNTEAGERECKSAMPACACAEQRQGGWEDL